MEGYMKTASPGHCFVETEKGHIRTMLRATEKAKQERKVGKPIRGYETKVPERWIEQGWVEEVVVSDWKVDSRK